MLLLFASDYRAGAQVTILHSFAGAPGDTAYPYIGLIQAPDGNFYGVTPGQVGKTGLPNGAVFQMTPAGVERVIARFPGSALITPLLYYKNTLIGVTYTPTGQNGVIFAVTGYPAGPWAKHFWHKFGVTAGDGIGPAGSVILGSDGKLYGATSAGGSAGLGTIYKVNPKSHKLTVVYSFTSNDATGVVPITALLQAKNGNFYGGDQGLYGGDIFEMTPDGQVAGLAAFSFNQFLTAPLIQGSDGNFYGTAGNSSNETSYPDFVFQLTPAGATTLLVSFPGQFDTTYGVTQGPNGNLYGVTGGGGTAGKGTVFELSTDGSSFKVLHNFGDGTIENDGAYPHGSLVLGSDNNFYGTTTEGGSAGLGTVFRISP